MDFESGKSFEVINSTIGQFVGIKDSNDEDIYEGDIVKCWEYRNGYWEHKATITIKNMFSDCFELKKFEHIEIMGNIH